MLRTPLRRLHKVGASIQSTSWPRTASSNGDKILLEGLVFHGFHGVFKEEQKLGQKFVVDATLTTNLESAGTSDDLKDSVDYAAVYMDIKSIVEGPPQQLIESVAERIASTILHQYSRVSAVQVRVRKPHVALPGVVDALGVQILRTRRTES